MKRKSPPFRFVRPAAVMLLSLTFLSSSFAVRPGLTETKKFSMWDADKSEQHSYEETQNRLRDQSGNNNADSSSLERRGDLPSIQESKSTASDSTTSADHISLEELSKKSDPEILAQLKTAAVRNVLQKRQDLFYGERMDVHGRSVAPQGCLEDGNPAKIPRVDEETTFQEVPMSVVSDGTAQYRLSKSGTWETRNNQNEEWVPTQKFSLAGSPSESTSSKPSASWRQISRIFIENSSRLPDITRTKESYAKEIATLPPDSMRAEVLRNIQVILDHASSYQNALTARVLAEMNRSDLPTEDPSSNERMKALREHTAMEKIVELSERPNEIERLATSIFKYQYRYVEETEKELSEIEDDLKNLSNSESERKSLELDRLVNRQQLTVYRAAVAGYVKFSEMRLQAANLAVRQPEESKYIKDRAHDIYEGSKVISDLADGVSDFFNTNVGLSDLNQKATKCAIESLEQEEKAALLFREHPKQADYAHRAGRSLLYAADEGRTEGGR